MSQVSLLVFVLVLEFGNYATALDLNCPLWHVKYKETCKCGNDIYGLVVCTENQKLKIEYGFCMTWNNAT